MVARHTLSHTKALQSLERATDLSADRDGAVVVAMTAVFVVKVPLHDVVAVVAMRDRLVPAARAMTMGLFVAATLMIRRTSRRIRGAHRDRVLLDLRPGLKMQVPIV
jgi:hypothetical protein